MLPGECIQKEETTCCDCKATLKLDVFRSAAGWYIGFFCFNCGPYSRESGYYKSQREAQWDLENGEWKGRWE